MVLFIKTKSHAKTQANPGRNVDACLQYQEAKAGGLGVQGQLGLHGETLPQKT